VGGESDDTGISGPRLGQDRDSPVRGREPARGDIAQEGRRRLAPKRITYRLACVLRRQPDSRRRSEPAV
jgi:hypothetical protein